jgi:hypothetical protein
MRLFVMISKPPLAPHQLRTLACTRFVSFAIDPGAQIVTVTPWLTRAAAPQ